MSPSLKPDPERTYRPFGLLAEVTYRCPLHCPYCSNPIHMPGSEAELSAEEWQRVLREAAELGVLQVLFSGGEPLLRKDLPALIATAHQQGMYTNLITSGLGLSRSRLQSLLAAGLDNVQISLQADQAELADLLAGTPAHQRKLMAAHLIRAAGLPLTLNVVLHRANIERLEPLIALAEQIDAQRLELANAQYLGWAFLNTTALLPTREQVEQAQHIALAAQTRLRGRMEILYVLPDYFGQRPKPCMHGWGQRHLAINPLGGVLPCQTASIIPDLPIENVRQHSLAWIWHESPSFQRFRGSTWMPELCQGCSLRDIDFGGCRCQAFLLTGNAARTDPVCQLSPDHQNLQNALESIHQQKDRPALRMRVNPI